VKGGAEGLLDLLIKEITKDGGLLCIPTHTWHNIGKDITLDITSDDTCVGELSRLAATDKRAYRTENPTHSMAIYGDRARAMEFAKNEGSVISGTAPDSCYGKLYSEGGYVLLIGVSHNKNTYLHAVDEMLGADNRLTEDMTPMRVKLASGEIVEHPMKTMYTDYTEDISNRFPLYETAFRYHRAISDSFVGNAPAQFCSAKIMYDTVKLIRERCGGDPLREEKAIPQKFYCN
jgi:aminoglycoside 3-N-acetyltransferase